MTDAGDGAATNDSPGNGHLLGTLSSVLTLGYKASFAGAGAYQPSSDRGPLAIVGGNSLF